MEISLDVLKTLLNNVDDARRFLDSEVGAHPTPVMALAQRRINTAHTTVRNLVRQEMARQLCMSNDLETELKALTNNS